VKGNPKGKGSLFWENGDTCIGEIKGTVCSGKKISATEEVTNGKFEFKFDHDTHQFDFGKFISEIC
jgi:hypothetical protein